MCPLQGYWKKKGKTGKRVKAAKLNPREKGFKREKKEGRAAGMASPRM